ncbi:hypothetical protein BIW11_13543, partial [Tropilaelaps mercedesae]
MVTFCWTSLPICDHGWNFVSWSPHQLQEGEAAGFSAEDVQIARTLCGDANPVFWLQTNWAHIIETVIHLTSSYVAENALENVGQLSVLEAQAALRRQRGNVWNSVVDAVERRQAAFQEIASKGPFKPDQILQELRSTQGNVDQAVAQLSNHAMNAFLVKMYAGGGSSTDGNSLSRASSENTVAADDKIAFWLHNAKPSSISGSSVMSSSSESIDLLAGPDQQLHKLDQLMMKRYMQKKEETRYKKYKERVGHARQHHEGAIVAETGYFDRNPRPASYMSTPSVDQASSVATRTTNIEEVIEQRIQSGISTILSAIETTFKKEQAEQGGKSSDQKANGRNQWGSNSEKPLTQSKNESRSKGQDDTRTVDEAIKSEKDLASGKVKKVDKVNTDTKRCKDPSPQRGVMDTESELEENRFVPPQRGSQKAFTQAVKEGKDDEHAKTSQGGRPGANKVQSRGNSPGTSNATNAEFVTEASDASGDKDYSEVELAVATVTQTVIVSPPEIQIGNGHNGHDSDDNEEFQEVSEFLDVSVPHISEVHQADPEGLDRRNDVPEVRDRITVTTNSTPHESGNPNGVVQGLAIQPNDLAPNVPAFKAPSENAEKPKHFKTARRRPLERNQKNESSQSVHEKQSVSCSKHLNRGVDGPLILQHQAEESLDSITGLATSQTDKVVPRFDSDQIPPLKTLVESHVDDQDNNDTLAVTRLQVETVASSSGEAALSMNTASEDEARIDTSHALEDATLPKVHDHSEANHPMSVPAMTDLAADQTAEKDFLHIDDARDETDEAGENAGQHENLPEISDFLTQEDAYWAKQDHLEQEDQNDDEAYADDEDRSGNDYEALHVERAAYDNQLNVDGDFTTAGPANGAAGVETSTLDVSITSVTFPGAEVHSASNTIPEGPHVVNFVPNLASARTHRNTSTDALSSQENRTEEAAGQVITLDVESNSPTNGVVPLFEQNVPKAKDDQIRNDSLVEKKAKKLSKKKGTKNRPSLDTVSGESAVLNGSTILEPTTGASNGAVPTPIPGTDVNSSKEQLQKDGHDSNDYSDVSDEEPHVEPRRSQGSLAGQAAVMKILRKSLEDLARLGGKPQKVASKHVVYRRPSIRRRSTIVVVDRGDGFGRFPGGDAIIIKPQGGLEKALRISGQDVTK